MIVVFKNTPRSVNSGRGFLFPKKGDMSRKYVNERWCVRCSRQEPTPYLRKKFDTLVKGLDASAATVIDIGCGNLRNTVFMRSKGFHTKPFDMAGDAGGRLVLGKDAFPLNDNSVDLILANYILMFLDYEERAMTIKEVDRVSKVGARIMVELYAAKDSKTPDKESLKALRSDMICKFGARGWSLVHGVQERFILQKE